MIGRILFLLALAFAVELFVLVEFGQRFGFGATILLVLLTAAVGTRLARHEGMGAWARLQNALAHGTKPDAEILDGVIIMASAALLVVPGFLSDIVGLLGLLPFTRPLIRRELAKRLKRERGSHPPVDIGPSVGGTARVRPSHLSHESGIPK